MNRDYLAAGFIGAMLGSWLGPPCQRLGRRLADRFLRWRRLRH